MSPKIRRVMAACACVAGVWAESSLAIGPTLRPVTWGQFSAQPVRASSQSFGNAGLRLGTAAVGTTTGVRIPTVRVPDGPGIGTRGSTVVGIGKQIGTNPYVRADKTAQDVFHRQSSGPGSAKAALFKPFGSK
jgi:hypothetical protein